MDMKTFGSDYHWLCY